ncbi:MAG: hypothetical protein ACR2KJ_14340 [Jatrophihabitans sp.]
MEMTKTMTAADGPTSAAPKNALLTAAAVAYASFAGSASHDTTGVRNGMQPNQGTAVIDSVVSPHLKGFTGGVPPREVPR